MQNLQIAEPYFETTRRVETSASFMVKNVEVSKKISAILSWFRIQQVQATQDGTFTFYDRDRHATSNPCRTGTWDEHGFIVGIRNRDLPPEMRVAGKPGHCPITICFTF